MPGKIIQALTNRKIIWPLILVWLTVIFILSSVSNPPQPVRGDELFMLILTSIEHLIEYIILGFLLFYGFTSLGEKYREKALFLAVIVVFLYGASDEIHQSFVPYRECDIIDLLVDTLGGIIGAAIAAKLAGLLRKHV